APAHAADSRPPGALLRGVTPADVAAVGLDLPSLRDHPLLLSRHEVEQRIAAPPHETARPQERLDLLPGPAAEERQLVADRRVLLTRTRDSGRAAEAAGVELPIHHGETAVRAEHPRPLVDRGLRARERPEHVTADDEVEATGRERELFRIGLL